MTSTLPEPLAEKMIAEKIQEWEKKKQREKELRDQAGILIHPFLGISRDFGCGEETLVPLLEKTLGWKVYGRNLLDYLAKRDNLSRSFMETLDEHGQLLVDKWVHYLIHSGAILQEDYVVKISRLIQVIVAQENAIIVGRGVNCILAGKREGLRIRITAPFADRVQNIAKLRNLSAKEAEQMVRKTDRERAVFIRNYFGKDISDPSCFDIGFNTSRVSADMILKTVSQLLEQKQPERK